MTNATFLFSNLWDQGTLTYSSQASNFPAINTRKRWATEAWRSRYGSGSGWGNFVVTAGVNDDIDFEEAVATPLLATLDPGTYTADTLATEIKTQLEITGAETYTVTYDANDLKFTITSAGVGGGTILNLNWLSGPNTATSAKGLLGFTANDTGTDEYTSDVVVIHSEEWLKNDFGVAKDIQAFAVKNHNLQSGAIAKIQGTTSDTWGSPTVDVTLAITADIVIYHWSAVQSYRWWRYKVNDTSNPDGYTEAGRIFLGDRFSPEGNFKRDYSMSLSDPSQIMLSDGGQITSNQKTKFKTLKYVFEYTSASDRATFEEMFDSRGYAKDMFFTQDRDNQGTTSYYIRLIDMGIEHVSRDELFHITVELEELR